MSNAELPKTFEEWRKGKMVDAIGEAYDAWHARDAELAEKDRRIAKLEGQLQRATDLVRFARHFLHNENCISDEEYAAIVADSDGRVARLEGYDKVRTALEARIAAGMALVEKWEKAAPHNPKFVEVTIQACILELRAALKGGES